MAFFQRLEREKEMEAGSEMRRETEQVTKTERERKRERRREPGMWYFASEQGITLVDLAG